MKVCVYGLAKNQEYLCNAWYESVKHADEIIIGDLGSTDRTKDILQRYGVKVYDIRLSTFRQDLAMNTLLTLISKDIDLAVRCNLNQVISTNWKTFLIDDWLPGTDRVSCLYKGQQDFNIIHTARGYLWENAIFAELKNKPSEQVVNSKRIIVSDVQEFNLCDIEPLLELSLSENPSNDMLQWEYTLILFEKLQIEKAFDIVKDFSSNPNFDRVVKLFKKIAIEAKSDVYRSEAMIKLSHMLPTDSHYWLTRAVAETPWYWKSFHELAKYYHKNNEWYFYLANALKSLDLLNSTDTSLRGQIHDNISIAARNCNFRDLSLEHANLAASLLQNDPRIQQNLKTIKDSFNL